MYVHTVAAWKENRYSDKQRESFIVHVAALRGKVALQLTKYRQIRGTTRGTKLGKCENEVKAVAKNVKDKEVNETEPLLRIRQLRSYSRVSLHFVEAQGSLLSLRNPIIGPCLEPDQSRPCHPVYLSKNHFSTIIPPTYMSSKCSPSFWSSYENN
jgi:hypothetical protein